MDETTSKGFSSHSEEQNTISMWGLIIATILSVFLAFPVAYALSMALAIITGNQFLPLFAFGVPNSVFAKFSIIIVPFSAFFSWLIFRVLRYRYSVKFFVILVLFSWSVVPLVNFTGEQPMIFRVDESFSYLVQAVVYFSRPFFYLEQFIGHDITSDLFAPRVNAFIPLPYFFFYIVLHIVPLLLSLIFFAHIQKKWNRLLVCVVLFLLVAPQLGAAIVRSESKRILNVKQAQQEKTNRDFIAQFSVDFRRIVDQRMLSGLNLDKIKSVCDAFNNYSDSDSLGYSIGNTQPLSVHAVNFTTFCAIEAAIENHDTRICLAMSQFSAMRRNPYLFEYSIRGLTNFCVDVTFTDPQISPVTLNLCNDLYFRSDYDPRDPARYKRPGYDVCVFFASLQSNSRDVCNSIPDDSKSIKSACEAVMANIPDAK